MSTDLGCAYVLAQSCTFSNSWLDWVENIQKIVEQLGALKQSKIFFLVGARCLSAGRT